MLFRAASVRSRGGPESATFSEGEQNIRASRKSYSRPRDIQLVLAEPPTIPTSCPLTLRSGAYPSQNAGRTWKAFKISAGGYESASGEIPFDVHDGQRLRLRGFKGVYNGKPQLLVVHAEPLPVEYADDRRRIFGQNKIPARYFDDLVATLGSDFAARISAESRPHRLGAAKNKIRNARENHRMHARASKRKTRFPRALRKCGVAEPTVAALSAKHPDGLARLTAYDLIDYRLLDENRPRGPRRGLTGGEADKLAQSDYALSFRPFDPQNLERARGHVEHLARERMELRGDVGASIARDGRRSGEAVRAQQRLCRKRPSPSLAEELVFRLDPADPDHLWLAAGSASRGGNRRACVHARLTQAGGQAPSRRVGKRVTLFPRS